MNKIKLLDQHCINQIAAGEVVERPLSVVKELIENALDASAKNIEISVEGGGTSLIKIKDDGIGISAEDLRLALLPHATCKITHIGDLDHLQTLGFRGEALPSIASVSKLSILSRTLDEVSGYEIQVEGGNVISLTETGCPIGTVVTVKELFYNTPARQKFLRSATTEFGLISDMVSRIALARPDVSFTLRHPRNIVFNTPGKGNLLDAIASVIGPETARKMLPVSWTEENFSISGYVSAPNLVRSSRNGITFIVNGRVIRSQLLNQALRDSYYTLIPSGTYPLAVLSLTLPPSDYDVNVHPAKLEIRFRSEKELSEKITHSVKNVIQRSQLPETTIKNNAFNVPQKDKVAPVLNNNNWEQLKLLYKPLAPVKDESSSVNYAIDQSREFLENRESVQTRDLVERSVSLAESNAIGYSLPNANELQRLYNLNETNKIYEITTNHLFQEIRAIGQVFNTYILCTNDKSLYFIDQHAAHERIKYNRLLKQVKENSLSSQLLVMPITIDLTVQEEHLLLEHLSDLQELGFIIEHFGERTYFIRGVPLLKHLEYPGELFKLFLDELLSNSLPPNKEKLLEKWIFMIACRSAIKGQDRLTIQEMDEIIQELGKTPDPYSCPHGRPTIIEITKPELEKKFYR